jgi:hypothetical protein
MILPKLTQGQTWSRTLQIGAGAGVGLTFAYAAVFALYAICRSSLNIWEMTPPEIGMFGTLAANAVSILLASLATACVLAPLMALLGMGTAAAIKWLDAIFNPNRNILRAMIIGVGAALVFVVIVDFGVQMLMGRSLNSLGVETYLFWFGLPGLVHIGAGAAAAWHLHRTIVNDPVVRREVNYVSPDAYTRAG